MPQINTTEREEVFNVMSKFIDLVECLPTGTLIYVLVCNLTCDKYST